MRLRKMIFVKGKSKVVLRVKDKDIKWYQNLMIKDNFRLVFNK